MFSKILIANRGEIAVRVIRACKEMGIRTVAVFSEADRSALHVSLADESLCIGPAQARLSYLNRREIAAAAVLSGCEAVHPGYGLLSEDAEFARMLGELKIAFIGPKPESISAMGDKDEARRTMAAAGVPIIPGSGLINDINQARAEAKRIGYPLLLKARSGGGGRGIRLVKSADEIKAAFSQAASEARSAFGDSGIYMEKYLTRVKHIEMQIMADSAGNIVCLGERDCSVQRLNQKLIEESPSAAVDERTRRDMMTACERAVVACGYEGVGTVEFLLTEDRAFYFMEMNTRLQVEHPVTEMVTGIDIVKWQIRLAAGQPLPFNQSGIVQRGHAIECRINAENPRKGFRPSAGTITMLHIPGGPWVRFDTALYQGYTIPPFYDSMIGKLIVHAPTREDAIRKMRAALCEMVIEGIEHNQDLQIELLSDPGFVGGGYTTDLLKRKEIRL